MGRNARLKKLRKKLFNDIGKKDRADEREYEEKSVIYENQLGYKVKKVTKISKRLHRQYRVLKREI